jgi:hypothetical protein
MMRPEAATFLPEKAIPRETLAGLCRRDCRLDKLLANANAELRERGKTWDGQLHRARNADALGHEYLQQLIARAELSRALSATRSAATFWGD